MTKRVVTLDRFALALESRKATEDDWTTRLQMAPDGKTSKARSRRENV